MTGFCLKNMCSCESVFEYEGKKMVIEKLPVIHALKRRHHTVPNVSWVNQAVRHFTSDKCEPVIIVIFHEISWYLKTPEANDTNSCNVSSRLSREATDSSLSEWKAQTACYLQHHLGAKERAMRARKQFCFAASPQQSSNSDGPATSERSHPKRSRAPHAPSDSRIFLFFLRCLHSCKNRDRVYLNDWRDV